MINIEKIKITKIIYILINSLGNEEILTEQSLISQADSFAYVNNYDSICNLSEAVDFFKEMGYKVYKLTNIQIENL